MTKFKSFARVILSLFLVFSLCCVTACNKEDKTEIEQILAEGNKYEFLTKGRNRIINTLPMFCYYDDASYQRAKESAVVSASVAAEYFPSVKYNSSGFATVAMKAELETLSVSAASESNITYVCQIRRSSKLGSSLYTYKIGYSRITDTITSVEKIGTFY